MPQVEVRKPLTPNIANVPTGTLLAMARTMAVALKNRGYVVNAEIVNELANRFEKGA